MSEFIDFFESKHKLQFVGYKLKELITKGVVFIGTYGIVLRTSDVLSYYNKGAQMLNTWALKNMSVIEKNWDLRSQQILKKSLEYYKSGDPVSALEQLNQTPLSNWKNDNLTRLDYFFGKFGLSLKRIPIVNRIDKVLTNLFGNNMFSNTIYLSIVAVLVIMFIIAMYHLIKFLYKLYRIQKLKAQLSDTDKHTTI